MFKTAGSVISDPAVFLPNFRSLIYFTALQFPISVDKVTENGV